MGRCRWRGSGSVTPLRAPGGVARTLSPRGGRKMQRQAIVGAVISTDSQFRTALRECGNGNGDGARIEIAFEIIVPFIELSHGHLEELRYVDPEIVFIDLEGDPVLGCKLAQYLAEQNPNRRLIGAGSGNTPDFLMQAMQAGIGEYLPKPVTEEALTA